MGGGVESVLNNIFKNDFFLKCTDFKDFFSKIVLIVRILKKNVRIVRFFLKIVRIFFRKLYELYGFFQKSLATLEL